MSESGRNPSESPEGLEAFQNLKMETQNIEMSEHCVFLVACIKSFFIIVVGFPFMLLLY